jgi:two-component system phosphate regulon sensor histidine kinase PhoR
LKLVPLDLAAFFEQLAKDWKIQCGRKQVTFDLDLPCELPPLVADELRLGQVFNNLIENALKYTSPQGRIQLRARSAGAEVELSVEDDGAGIPADDVPHIFERFYRADKARSREQGGTGLGLSIVKHIVQVHGGRVEARSTQGEGTVILIHLPVEGPGQTSTV